MAQKVFYEPKPEMRAAGPHSLPARFSLKSITSFKHSVILLYYYFTSQNGSAEQKYSDKNPLLLT